MANHLTGEQIRAVVAEISAQETHAIDTLGWRIETINHLYYLPVEAYLVGFRHGDSPMEPAIYVREDGKLTPHSGWSYHASDNFEDMHKPYSTPGNEAQA